jgi:hypothetical protein
MHGHQKIKYKKWEYIITMHLKEVELEEVRYLKRGNELSLPVSQHAGTLSKDLKALQVFHSMQLAICLYEDILMSHKLQLKNPKADSYFINKLYYTTQHVMTIPYRRFENIFRTHSQGSRSSLTTKSQKNADFIYFAAETSNHAS